MTVHVNSCTNILRVWKWGKNNTQKNLLEVDFCMLFDKWYISDNFKYLIPWRDVQVDSYTSDDCVPQAMRKDSLS